MERRSGYWPACFNDALTGDQIALLYQDAAFAGQTPVEFALSEPHLPDQVRDRRRLHLYGLRQRFRSWRQGVKFTSSGQRDRSVHGRRRIHEASGDNTLQSLAVTLPRGIPAERAGISCARPRGPIPARHGRIHRLTIPPSRCPDHRAPRAASGRRGIDREFGSALTTPKTGHPRRRVRRLDHRRRRAGDQPQHDGGRRRPADRRERLCTDQGPHAGQRRKLPTLDAYLEQGAKDASMKLICEIKTHSSAASNYAGHQRRRGRRQGEVDGDAGRLHRLRLRGLQRLRAAMPAAGVQYLGGDKAPAEVAADKLLGHRLPVFDRAFEKTRVGDGSPTPAESRSTPGRSIRRPT